ncbi:hypothetical protein M433DRAFT_5535 [Acidomyces richmondensis BFW]|nr:MAG: hypothetical protein FE78DRAFT_28936 [Acidomyces sp. 'richmondensis']KYG44336.1 hypothetical protein M433DRAFT_5535 [Acidomyces richmondensis BFW]
MGLFDGRSYSDSERLRTHSHPSSHHHSSQSRGYSPARSSASQGYFVRPHNSRSASSSFLGGGGSTSRGLFGGGSSSSYYRRRPRDGYISYLMHKLQRMLRDLWYYARRHPVKAFFAVVVPLLSAGGAIHGLLRQFGVRVPIFDGATRQVRGGYYGSSGYGGSRAGGGGGWMDNAGSLMQMAKLFM